MAADGYDAQTPSCLQQQPPYPPPQPCPHTVAHLRCSASCARPTLPGRMARPHSSARSSGGTSSSSGAAAAAPLLPATSPPAPPPRPAASGSRLPSSQQAAGNAGSEAGGPGWPSVTDPPRGLAGIGRALLLQQQQHHAARGLILSLNSDTCSTHSKTAGRETAAAGPRTHLSAPALPLLPATPSAAAAAATAAAICRTAACAAGCEGPPPPGIRSCTSQSAGSSAPRCT